MIRKAGIAIVSDRKQTVLLLEDVDITLSEQLSAPKRTTKMSLRGKREFAPILKRINNNNVFIEAEAYPRKLQQRRKRGFVAAGDSYTPFRPLATGIRQEDLMLHGTLQPFCTQSNGTRQAQREVLCA